LRITIPPSRLSVRIFRFAVLALLAGAFAVPPFGLVAQDSPAPATATQAAPGQANEAAAQPAQKEEKKGEDENVYRHTALVTSIAKALNLPVETTARLFEFINFAIIALAILIPLVRFIPKVIRKRNITLSHNLETARKTTVDANTRLSAVEAQLSRLDEEIAKIRAQVEEESRQDEARIKASIEEESVRIVAAAEQEITVAAAQAKRGLRHFAADLAIEQAAKQLVLTPETDRALIAEFVREASENGASNGATDRGSSRGNKGGRN
jgi:F-type H+-transporting ATPase subunit b